MEKFKLSLKVIFLSLFSLMLSSHFSFLFSEAELIEDYPQEVETYPQEKKPADCSKDFYINKVDFNDPRVAPIVELLTGCIYCRSVVKDDIEECGKLSLQPSLLEDCRVNFTEYQGIYGRFFKSGFNSLQLMNSWKDRNSEGFKLFMQGVLNNDSSVCEKAQNEAERNECRAFTTGNVKLCKNDFCVDKVIYIKAIKEKNLSKCNGIKDPNIRLMCQGYISGDETTCEKYKGFEEFIQKYCATLNKEARNEKKAP